MVSSLLPVPFIFFLQFCFSYSYSNLSPVPAPVIEIDYDFEGIDHMRSSYYNFNRHSFRSLHSHSLRMDGANNIMSGASQPRPFQYSVCAGPCMEADREVNMIQITDGTVSLLKMIILIHLVQYIHQCHMATTAIIPCIQRTDSTSRSAGQTRYCLVASKQMVGIFLMIWVRSDIRQDISLSLTNSDLDDWN